MKTNKNIQFGIVIMLFSSVVFAVLYLFSSWMKPLNGTSVFAWRMVATFLGLLLLIKLGNKTTEMRDFLFSLRTSPKKRLNDDCHDANYRQPILAVYLGGRKRLCR